jgi:hypothetical protein
MEESFTEYFANYAKCYDDFDPERLAKYFYTPTVNIKNGSVVAISNSSDVLAYLRSLVISYREQGLKKANLVNLDVKMLGWWSALITVHWIIDHTNGSILRDFHTSYNLFKNGDSWLILMTTNHDVPEQSI